MIFSIIFDFIAVLICGSFTIIHICEGNKVPAIITFGLTLIDLSLLVVGIITFMQS